MQPVEFIERWRPIVGFEGLYLVSDQGNFKSVDRLVSCAGGGKRTVVGKQLTLWRVTNGHARIDLWKNNKAFKFAPGRLVLEAFSKPCPDGMECCHNDGNPFNNRLDNLRWDTRSNNQLDRRLHGTHNRKRRQGTAQLTEKDVIIILNAKGYVSKKELAERFKVSESTICDIHYGRTWKHITNNPEVKC